MKKSRLLGFALLSSFVIVGCSPHLIIKDASVTWNPSANRADATIQNIGDKDSGPFLVYFDVDLNPSSSIYVPRITCFVPGLAKGDALKIRGDFHSVSPLTNGSLGKVSHITVRIDPKNFGIQPDANEGVSIVPLDNLPDLVVEDVQPAGPYSVKAVIRNIGNLAAGEFLLYFDADEDPTSSNERPQIRFDIPGLAVGASVERTADFEELKHPENHNLHNVFQITVRADPKQMVGESNEYNNISAIPYTFPEN